MYTTKSLSIFKNTQEEMAMPESEGPNSGYLVLQDKETTPRCFFGLIEDTSITNLPFPQNKLLSIKDSHNDDETIAKIYVIPVINQPLSSNRYYVIKADGKHKGEAYASSRNEDKVTCCFNFKCITDVKPRPLDSEDIYQQFEFSISESRFFSTSLKAKSVAPYGHLPSFFRRIDWTIKAKNPKTFTLREARGLDSTLRAHFPDFTFSVSQQCSNPVVVGKWYCPFMFIKEGTEKERFEKSMFYEMTLEQRWEKIFGINENDYDERKIVSIDVVVQTERIMLGTKKAMLVEGNDGYGVVWFRCIEGNEDDEQVGLSHLIVERMMWEQDRGGWIKAEAKEIRIVKDIKYEGGVRWKSFGCYMLVESFVLKRNDGSLFLTYDFWHSHKLRNQWA